jgi:2-C-methyl-D-erythritol 4-phosphate cytidylyltransferase
MGMDNRKQFLELEGRPLYMWSVWQFRMRDDISRIIVVAPPDMVHTMQAAIDDMEFDPQCGKHFCPTKVVAGGANRQESVFIGLTALAAAAEVPHAEEPEQQPSHVLVHDAARPFVSHEIIDRVIDTLKETDACTVAIPASDTVKRVVDGRIVETLNREQLYLIQTPQGARFDILYRAHQEASKSGVATTDDAAILEAAGVEVAVMMGSRVNIKVTEKDDLQLSQAIATILGTGLM